MSRPSLFALAASLAAVAVGCAHCDTCDDFPAPCTGPNCGYPYQAAVPFGDGMHVEPIVDGPLMMPGGMPAGQIVSGPIGTAPGAQGPTIVPPAPIPADGAASGGQSSPPSGPPAAPGGGTGADPFDIPLPPTDSPFGGPARD